MPDRTINFGESETEATYQIQDTDGAAGGGNFVVAKDTNANTVLLEYDPASDTWEYAGDVDMNGGNVSGVGTLTANSVNTGQLDIGGSDQINEIEFATATVTPPSATSDDTWDSVKGTNTPVSFSTNFTNVPDIVVTGPALSGLTYHTTNESQSGFSIRVLNYSTKDRSTPDVDVAYIAIG